MSSLVKQELQKTFIGLPEDEYDRFWRIEDYFETEDGCVFRTYDDDGNLIEEEAPEGRVKDSAFIGTEYSAVCCTGFALRIQQKLPGRVKIFGYFADENPEAGTNQCVDGHDFAIVDERYIVDPWLVDVERGWITTHKGKKLDLKGQGVFDLEDMEDSDLILEIYGLPKNWKPMKVGKKVVHESQ